MQRLNYEDAVKFLTEHPDEIFAAWDMPSRHVAGALFDYLTPSRKRIISCGCATEVKSGYHHSFGGRMDEFIRSLPLPEKGYHITAADLPLFKKVQEEADLVYENRNDGQWLSLADVDLDLRRTWL